MFPRQLISMVTCWTIVLYDTTEKNFDDLHLKVSLDSDFHSDLHFLQFLANVLYTLDGISKGVNSCLNL